MVFSFFLRVLFMISAASSASLLLPRRGRRCCYAAGRSDAQSGKTGN